MSKKLKVSKEGISKQMLLLVTQPSPWSALALFTIV